MKKNEFFIYLIVYVTHLKALLTLKLKRNPAIFNSYIQIKKMSSIDIDSFASQFDNMAIKGKCLTTHIDTFNYVKKNYRGQKKRQARTARFRCRSCLLARAHIMLNYMSKRDLLYE